MKISITKVVAAIALNKNKFHIVNAVASLLDKNDKKTNAVQRIYAASTLTILAISLTVDNSVIL